MPLPSHAQPRPTDASAALSSLGLRGVWSQVANLSAVAIIALGFLRAQETIVRTGAEDRQMFREELRSQRDTLDRATRAVEQLAEQIRRGALHP